MTDSEKKARRAELFEAFEDELLARLTPRDMVRFARHVLAFADGPDPASASALILRVLAPDQDQDLPSAPPASED